MIWFVSDPHGCYEEFKELLDKIGFDDEDEMYLLGDIVDRGPEPIRLLCHVMNAPNIFLLAGNHDMMAYKVLSKLGVEITPESIDALREQDFSNYLGWMYNGGGVTLNQFSKLDRDTQADIIDFLGDLSLYEDLSIGGKRYILTHSGFMNFDPFKPLEDYTARELTWARPDYRVRYFLDPDTFVVTGHTPTMTFREDEKPEIFQGNGHIAIDCGCVFGGKLAAYAPETGQCVYVDSRQKSDG